MTTLEIVDKIYPLTKEDNKCGINKATKFRMRADLIKKISALKKQGKELPQEIKALIE